MTEQQLKSIWKEALHDIKGEYAVGAFRSWFTNSSIVSLTNDHLHITVENSVNTEMLRRFAEKNILRACSKHIGHAITSLTISHSTTSTPPSTEADSLFAQPITAPATPKKIEHSEITHTNLNPKYTFSTFIIGTKNRLAHAAARVVAEKPGEQYNPLYLYGGVGLGKTHLMQAVGNEIIRKEPQKRVIYISCEAFMNEYVSSIRGNKMESFKKKYRSIDVFLIDDIQFIGGKEGIQEEFFHTFNSLYQSNKQIVITSDKAPSDIANLEERLISRFGSGMIADMQLPDLETRQAILLSKCEEKGIKLPHDVLLYIADVVDTNIRELEGTLSTILLSIAAEEISPDLAGVQQKLQGLIKTKPIKKTTFEHIRDIVCDYYSVRFEDIQGPRRQHELVKPRQILMYLLKNELGMTFPTIGKQIGGRDHTTVMYASEKIEKEMKRSPELLAEIQYLKEQFYVGSRA
jgi:chromosomal replication initiator protein